MQSELAPIRTRRAELQQHIPEIYEMLQDGSRRAEAAAAKTLDRVKAAMQINYFDDRALIESQAEKYKNA